MSLFGKKESNNRSAGDGIDMTTQIPPDSAGYGIADVIRLMRTLPVDQDVKLIDHVIRSTLESANVHVRDIVEDATRREQSLHDRMAMLQSEIAQFEKETQTRREEITRLEAALAEITRAKERLELAERVGHSGAPGAVHVPTHSDAVQGHPPPPPVRSKPPETG